VTVFNEAAEKLTGWKAEEATGRPLHEVFNIVNEETRKPAVSPVERVLREGVVVGLANHTVLVARDGTERPIADSGADRDFSGRTAGVVLVFRDQTERPAERASAGEAQLRTIIESLGEGLVVSALDGQLLHWNRAALDMHGFASPEEGRRQLSDLAEIFELSAMDGTVLPPEKWPLARILRGETVRDLEIRVRRLGGDWNRVYSRGVQDRDGTPLLAFVSIRDITEHKQAEEALRDADRHKNEFLGVLSHELRNPLAPIRNSLYLLDRVAPESGQAARAKAVLTRQTDHLARLIDDLLDVTRIAHGKITLSRAIIDAREVAQHTCDDHRAIADQLGVDLRIDLPAEAVWIDADETRLSQVVGNLLRTRQHPRGGATAVWVGVADGRAELRCDEGIGMDPGGHRWMFGRSPRPSAAWRGRKAVSGSAFRW
jgi:PAS domain S-box-containing protein